MKKVIVILFEIFFLLLIIAVAILNICITNPNNSLPDFWNVNVAQLITPLVALLIAFWATQFKNDQRKAKEHAEKIIMTIQNLVTSEQFSAIPSDGVAEDIRKDILTRNRTLSNRLQILEEYSKALNFSDEFKIINEKFNDYKTKIGEHISNLGYLSETEAEFRKIAESIDFQCESIILKFYK